MSDLINHIKEINAQTKAWQEQDPRRWGSYLSEDVEWWAERGVHTVADFERWELTCDLSDLAKEAYGSRSACPSVGELTNDEIIQIRVDMIAAINAEEERQTKSVQRAIKRFEKLVADTIAAGAEDRETAIRWIREADNDPHEMYDDGYFEFTQELPYGYLAKRLYRRP